MRLGGLLLGAVAAAAIIAGAGAASADTSEVFAIQGDFGNIYSPGGNDYGIFGGVLKQGTTYDYTFTLTEAAYLAFQLSASLRPATPEPINFNIYSNGAAGSDPTNTVVKETFLGGSAFGNNSLFANYFKPGNYFVEITNVAASGEQASGSLTLGSVPEPATWTLMLLGVGGLGMAMRAARRKVAMVAAAA